MEDGLKQMLRKILANQVAIYRKLDKIEQHQNNSLRSMGNQARVKELEKEAMKYLEFLE